MTVTMMGATMKITLDAARSLQEQKQRRQKREERERRERQKNSPSAKAKRRTEQARRDESTRLYKARYEAEAADEKAVPLYEAVLEHVDIRDPKFGKLRARLVITLKRVIAEQECHSTYFNRNDAELTKELARAKEILALLEAQDDAPAATLGTITFRSRSTKGAGP
jgi:hypothetical protein